jgi:EpsI family protein
MTPKARTARRTYTLCMAALIVSGAGVHALHHWCYSRPVQPLAVTLREFPKQLGPWQAQQEGLDAAVEELLRLQDFWSAVYVDGRGGSVSLFIGYYANEPVTRNHLPTICYPAAGWKLLWTDRQRLTVGPGAEVEMNRLQVERGRESQMVLYWFQLPDGTVADPMMSKVRRLRQLFKGHFSRSLVKVQIGVPMTGSPESAMERIRPFIGLVLKSLTECMGPGWAVPQPGIVETKEGGS